MLNQHTYHLDIMTLIWIGIVALMFGCSQCTPNARQGSVCHGHHCTNVVDVAIETLDVHSDNHLCMEINTQVDCAHHVTNGDEQLCGNDGKTYHNHCEFTKEMCHQLINNHHTISLNVASRGPCTTTTHPTTAAASPVTKVPTTATTATTASSTASNTAAATMDSTTATTLATTIGSIIANVFCQQVNSIDCNTGFNIVCGSDGQYYPNECELSKAKCLDSSLQKVDISNCNP